MCESTSLIITGEKSGGVAALLPSDPQPPAPDPPGLRPSRSPAAPLPPHTSEKIYRYENNIINWTSAERVCARAGARGGAATGGTTRREGGLGTIRVHLFLHNSILVFV
ncbi:hypothetical protein EVAR_3702_1 [Eumeta japonica]|uniref:C-type lectin domain-containing protein n=1 Tax=Eumeta variegata TaxID=151549 RepID=A0A4C1SRB2_EUMVA|nr:hypothetical protein EVAR_3702_1 [Eumeta japonica]